MLFSQLAGAGHRVATLLRSVYGKSDQDQERAWRELQERNAELAREVEDRARAAEALARSEERLRLAMEATAFGTFEWDIANDVVRCSPSVKKQLGLSSQQALTLADVLSRIHPEDREAVQATMRRALDPIGSRTYSGEFRMLLPDGGVSWLDGRGAVLFSQLGKAPVCMVGIVVDITAVKERERQLHQAAAELGRSNRLKDEFMATLAHELRNPLAPIRNGLEILTLQGLPNPAQRQACDMMSRQVKHIAHLVDDLLDISRIGQRKLALRREVVCVRQVIEGAVEAVLPQIEAARHELRVELPPEVVLLDVDPVRIVQAIVNLLSNSARYTPKGGRIDVRAARRGGEIELQVEDNGIGIAPTLLPHIFDMFTQDTERSSEAGLGIGLALTKALIEMHGGRLQAHSDGPGKGAIFRVWLPIAECGARPLAAEESAAPAACPRRRVLVVDDDADAADSTAALLDLMGHDVREARDGLEAIGVAREFAPEVILMDIGMPALDGLESAHRIRRLALEPRPTIVALTGWDPERNPAGAYESSFDTHLVKPVDAKSLARVLFELPKANVRA